MSDLLNKASLVMVPSGYKEDTVYSVVPSDGSGDLSFTRASNGTRVNSSGLVEVVPWNLVQQSESIGASPWSAINLGITSNATTAPNGTTTAEKLMVTTANTPHQVQQGFNNDSVNHTVSIYAKKGELNFIQLALGNSVEQYANFNLNTGVVGTKGSYCASSSIESVGDGWYRCIAYFNQGTIPSLMVYVTNSASSDWGGTVSYSGANNTDGLFVWGYQLNIGSTAKPYFPTTDRLNVPRLTYQNGGGGCPSLLLEKQSTNQLSYSEQIQNADWNVIGGDLVVTGNAVISPDGTQNAGAITLANSANRYFVHSIIGLTGGVAYTYSVYMKSASGNLLINMGGVNGLAGVMKTVTTEWQRFTYTFTPSTSYGEYFGFDNRAASASTSGTLYFWGAQVEASSYPTSYIPTTSSSATRVADLCYKTGISSLIGQTEGTIFCDVDLFQNNEACVAFRIDDGSNNNAIHFYFDSSQLNAFMSVSGTTQASISDFSSSLGRKKIAIVYKQNDFAFYVNGSLIGTDTSASVPTCSVVRLNGTSSSSLVSSYKINESVLFKTKLTNADCIALTTL